MYLDPYAPWCWNIYQHLPHKSPSFVGRYTIHGAFGWSWSSRWMEGRFTAVVYGLSDWLFWFMFKLAFDNWSIEVSLGFYHILPYHILPYLTIFYHRTCIFVHQVCSAPSHQVPQWTLHGDHWKPRRAQGEPGRLNGTEQFFGQCYKLELVISMRYMVTAS